MSCSDSAQTLHWFTNVIEEIVFIYNAKSGLFNAFLDWSHKIISPKTYECKLCAITYNNFGKEKKWREILFIRKSDEHTKIWEGEKLTKLQAKKISGIDNSFLPQIFSDNQIAYNAAKI